MESSHVRGRLHGRLLAGLAVETAGPGIDFSFYRLKVCETGIQYKS
jgi:hypothetical protein